MVQEKLITDQEIGVNQEILSITQRWGWMLFSMFVIAVLVEPAYIAQAQVGILHRIFSVSKYIAAGSVVFLYLIRRPKLDGFLLGCMIFETVILLSTFLNSANVGDWLHDSAYVIIFAMFLQIMMDIDRELLLRMLSMVLGLYVNINMLTRFMYPEGMYKHAHGYMNCWFLGYDNVACSVILVAMTVSLFRILSYRGKWKIWDWSVVIGGVWFPFFQGIATTIVAMVGFILFMIITRFERIRAIIGRAWLIIMGMVGLFLFIQLFVTQEIGLFSFIFQLLQRKSGFSGRAPLWQKAWHELGGVNIIFGLGTHNGSEYTTHFGKLWASHLHCYYLQVIYEGGLVAFGVLLGWLLHAARRFDQTKHQYCGMVLLAGMFALMIMWQVEAYDNITRYFIIVLFLLYNAKKFESLGQKYQYRKWRLVFHASRQCTGRRKVGGNIA